MTSGYIGTILPQGHLSHPDSCYSICIVTVEWMIGTVALDVCQAFMNELLCLPQSLPAFWASDDRRGFWNVLMFTVINFDRPPGVTARLRLNSALRPTVVHKRIANSVNAVRRGVRIPKFQHFMCHVVWHRKPGDTILRLGRVFLHPMRDLFIHMVDLCPLVFCIWPKQAVLCA